MRSTFHHLVGFVLAVALSNDLAADDFRMETEVFQGRQKVHQTLTLFSGELVYDFVKSAKDKIVETTIFDWRRNRFILLDNERQLKTELTTDQLMQVLDWLESKIYRPEDEDFSTRFEDAGKVVTVKGKKLTYQADGSKPKHPNAARRYQQFADWYARLNAIRAGNPPPYARIQLNSAMSQKGLIPSQVRRTTAGVAKKHEVHSKHATLWLLSNTDRQRIRKAGDHIVNYRAVTPKEFWRKEQVAETR